MNNNTTLIIAEAGVNHNGSLDLALELVDKAADANADIVKFQTFKAESLASQNTPKAQYQLKNTDNHESQLCMLKKLELDTSAHVKIIEHCNARKIQFLSTPFDEESVDFLVDQLGLTLLKTSSGDLTHGPLLLKIAQKKCKVILSTGMSMLSEIESALGILAYGYLQLKEKPSLSALKAAYCSDEGQHFLQQNVSLLHCTTEYPAPLQDVNLRAMDTLKNAFGLSVGYSDHTAGIAVPIAAVARGATIIEKHFTLDRNMEGPDHKASLEPNELTEMVQGIRQTEVALGSFVKRIVFSEEKNVSIARKSLVALKNIEQGDVFDATTLGIKRPGNGISAVYYWDYLGKIAQRNYSKDELIY